VSSENVEIVRRSFERFVETGVPDWEATHAEVLVVDHDIMDGTEYRGLEGVRRWVGDWSSAWSSFTMDPERFIDAGEYVVVIVQMKATGAASGIEIERQDGIVYRVRDGRVSRIDYFNSAAQALEAAGLPT
jgi:ketosteroid isomerase-like protein